MALKNVGWKVPIWLQKFVDTTYLYYCTYLLEQRDLFVLMHVDLAMYEALMRDQVTEKERTLILGNNIQRLFGLAE